LTAAAIKPSYIALGHIFPTETKDMPSCPQGIHRLRQYHIWASSIAQQWQLAVLSYITSIAFLTVMWIPLPWLRP
ncbi:thiamine phosphate synthase, partial [Teredinibacter franksiae]|uniref:thiamine phosphate synthase n=1 Tax=Teredinibacter franksiae TaxID=2761453 RepID=UPI001C89CACC